MNNGRTRGFDFRHPLIYWKKMPGRHSHILVNVFFCTLLISGCTIMPQTLTQEEIQTRVLEDLHQLDQDQEPVTKPIDLFEAMARALKYNLETKVEVMKTLLAHKQLDLSHYDLLPRLVANGIYDGRNKFSGGASRSLLTGQTSLESSTSADKNVFASDLTLSWDVLDFGLSYVRAQQAADDVLIAEEVKRRVANRVLRDVRSTYWRAVSAERVLPKLSFLETWVTKALNEAKLVTQRHLDSPLVSLQYERELLGIHQEIQQLYQDLAPAKVELAALMNIEPGRPYQLSQPDDHKSVPDHELNMEGLEYQALANRPELRAVDYQKRINAKETKAALLELLPSLNLNVGPNYSTNSFLFNNHWLAYGAKVSWNFLNVFRQPARFKVIEAQEQILQTQSLALTMTIMTQVHVAVAKLAIAKSNVANTKQYLDTQKKVETQIRHGWRTRRISERLFIREKLNNILAEIRYEVARAKWETAYAHLLATIGEDPLPGAFTDKNVNALAEALKAQWQGLTEAKDTSI